ncbi:hypothetical protein F2Q69_00032110 [Brassica cretica]|uniref:LNS2/PITP domain-containing protein n=1 Tax=Brassica cretica TaxID=69181 RepID=A0A8S9S131_BRACR|nr:hypothetical protein F2Q69_00032110 [Brassica cretica]
MSLVGRFGSLISQGVYSVATPFHPFGGAIDVIVVQQEDGSFHSTPWYVRFGKFQGVLKGAEKFVKISVNGTEADFHMYLDNSGEAYFIREVDPTAANDNTENNNGNENNGLRLEHSLSDAGAEREGFNSLSRLDRTESDCNRRYYDFQDDDDDDPPSPTSEYGEGQGSDSEVVLVSVDGRILTAPVSAAEQEAENLRLNTPQFHLAPGDGTEFCEGNTEFASSETSWDAEFISKVESSEKVDSRSRDITVKDSHYTELSQPGENVKSEEPAQNLKEGELLSTAVTENARGEDEVAVETVNTLIDGSESSTTQLTTEEVRITEESVDANTESECEDEQTKTSAETAILIESEASERVSIDSTREDDEQLTPSKPNKDSENRNTIDSVAATSILNLTLCFAFALNFQENGYQLLFLSARAIVQAYLTRSFLNNLKQDGKALPNGPVVISPDGLFPALYREVIRRAPHEFKIACLEDIRKLFPKDYNPFYAGFGNRDTDELSYRKLGIPKGKIFIINPKGEVATGHRIDVKKSYTSLHTLVNDMFPPTSLVEQEDYNPWNFWKLPVGEVD